MIRRRVTRTFCCLLIATALGACKTPEAAGLVSQPRGWDFVESMGGLTVGQPHRDPQGHVILPVHFDIGGPTGVSTTRSPLPSTIACDTPTARIDGQRILLTVNTCTATKRYHENRCPPADAGPIGGGEYEVAYRDPQGSEHPLGKVDIR